MIDVCFNCVLQLLLLLWRDLCCGNGLARLMHASTPLTYYYEAWSSLDSDAWWWWMVIDTINSAQWGWRRHCFIDLTMKTFLASFSCWSLTGRLPDTEVSTLTRVADVLSLDDLAKNSGAITRELCGMCSTTDWLRGAVWSQQTRGDGKGWNHNVWYFLEAYH